MYWSNEQHLSPPWTNWTMHDAIKMYLQENVIDVCVSNTGLHEAGHNHSDTQYVTNVKKYITYLVKYCRYVIWISISAVRGDPNFKQSNRVIKRWNQMILQIIIKEFPQVAYIDMFPMSIRYDMHVDNVHLNSTYYKGTARFFT